MEAKREAIAAETKEKGLAAAEVMPAVFDTTRRLPLLTASTRRAGPAGGPDCGAEELGLGPCWSGDCQRPRSAYCGEACGWWVIDDGHSLHLWP